MSDQTAKDGDKNRNKTAFPKAVRFMGFLFVALGFIAALYGVFVTARTPEGFTLANLSSFGSYAQGTVASLWSLGALFFLYATLLAQEKQINQQELQLEQQRQQFENEQKRQQAENEHQEKQFQLQQRAIQIQSFESSFFQLLNQQNQVVAAMRTDSAVSGQTKARKCFEIWFKEKLAYEFQNSWRRATGATTQKAVPEESQYAVECYLSFYESYQSELAHYFRNLYHVIKLVDTTSCLETAEEKRRYTSLVRAQLSAYELAILFYNGISPYGEKTKPLIEKYGLLEHLDKGLLLHPAHEDLYSDAYK